MTIGFEEDSLFYNGPLIDTRKDVNGEKVTTTPNSSVSEESIKETLVENDTKENIEVPKEAASKENETTFSYERDDE